MTFQNPSCKIFLNGWMDAQKHGRTSRKQYAHHFFKVGGIKIEISLAKLNPNKSRGLFNLLKCTIPF